MKTVREEVVGKSRVRLISTTTGYAGVVINSGKVSTQCQGADPDEVWERLLAEIGKASPSYYGFQGARVRFLNLFPTGFASPAYLFHERTYKLNAKAMLEATLTIDAAANAQPADAAKLMRVYSATNMLSPFELMRMKDILGGAKGPEFVAGASLLARGEVKIGLASMSAAAKPTTRLTWTMATYLPFLWNPDEHMFLKPTVTCDFATRVGHSFARLYSSDIQESTYLALQDLVVQTELELVDLNAQDRIDIQSFIWAVGKYPDEDVAKADAAAA